MMVGKSGVRRSAGGPCSHCCVTSTPCWRKGPPEKPILCNACGARYLVKHTLDGYMPGQRNNSISRPKRSNRSYTPDHPRTNKHIKFKDFSLFGGNSATREIRHRSFRSSYGQSTEQVLSERMTIWDGCECVIVGVSRK